MNSQSSQDFMKMFQDHEGERDPFYVDKFKDRMKAEGLLFEESFNSLDKLINGPKSASLPSAGIIENAITYTKAAFRNSMATVSAAFMRPSSVASQLCNIIVVGLLSCLILASNIGYRSVDEREGSDGDECCTELARRVVEFEFFAAHAEDRGMSMTISGKLNSALLTINEGIYWHKFAIGNSDRLVRVTSSTHGNETLDAEYKIAVAVKTNMERGVDKLSYAEIEEAELSDLDFAKSDYLQVLKAHDNWPISPSYVSTWGSKTPAILENAGELIVHADPVAGCLPILICGLGSGHEYAEDLYMRISGLNGYVGIWSPFLDELALDLGSDDENYGSTISFGAPLILMGTIVQPYDITLFGAVDNDVVDHAYMGFGVPRLFEQYAWKNGSTGLSLGLEGRYYNFDESLEEGDAETDSWVLRTRIGSNQSMPK